MTTQNPGFMTVKEAAAALNRSTTIVRNLAATGRLEHRRELRDNHNLIIVKAADVHAYRDARDAAENKPKTREAEFPIRREPMSLRDWFVGQALAGLCANPAFVEGGGTRAELIELGRMAYEISDYMCDGRDDCGEDARKNL